MGHTSLTAFNGNCSDESNKPGYNNEEDDCGNLVFAHTLVELSESRNGWTSLRICRIYCTLGITIDTISSGMEGLIESVVAVRGHRSEFGKNRMGSGGGGGRGASDCVAGGGSLKLCGGRAGDRLSRSWSLNCMAARGVAGRETDRRRSRWLSWVDTFSLLASSCFDLSHCTCHGSHGSGDGEGSD